MGVNTRSEQAPVCVLCHCLIMHEWAWVLGTRHVSIPAPKIKKKKFKKVLPEMMVKNIEMRPRF